MTHVGYLVVGWGGAALALVSYAVYLVWRGRVVSAGVPANRRRWLTSEDEA